MSCKGQYSDSFTNRQIFRTHIRHKYTFLTHSHAFRPSRQRMRTHLGQQDGAGTGAVHLACVRVRHPQSTEQAMSALASRTKRRQTHEPFPRTNAPPGDSAPQSGRNRSFRPSPAAKYLASRTPSTAEFCGDAPAKLRTRWLRAPSRMEAADVPDTKTPALEGRVPCISQGRTRQRVPNRRSLSEKRSQRAAKASYSARSEVISSLTDWIFSARQAFAPQKAYPFCNLPLKAL